MSIKRKYSSRSQQTTLTGSISASATSVAVVSVSAIMGGVSLASGEIFTVVLDPDTALEEIVDVTGTGPSVLLINRGVDGSTAQEHSAGAVVRHMIIGRDLREANDHINQSTGSVHGLTLANVVNTTDTGTVTSSMIADGTIVNGDVSSSAAIAYSKLNLTGSVVNGDIANTTITDAKIATSAGIAPTKIAGTAVTQADTGTVTSAMIANGTIVDSDINSSAAISISKLAVNPLSRTNHTGTQLASTISDFDTQVRTSKVTDLTAPTGSFSMNSQKITNLATPTATTDAATKAYADLMVPLTQVGAANGIATLGSDGKLTVGQIPDVTITDTFVVSSQSAMLALTAQVGDVAVRTDLNKSFILRLSGASTLSNWQELLTPTDSVLSVDGQTGAVSLSSTYATIANAANKLPLAGGTMSGAIAMGTNKITNLGTPTATDDAATKAYADLMLPLAGGTMSGVINMSTNKITNLGTPTANGDAVTKLYADTILVGAPGNLTGPITSVGAATSIASQTGTGTKFVMDTSPTLVTPNIGVATATSVNGTTIPTSKTLVVTTDKLNVHAATTSAELLSIISDETGSGALVFANAPTLSNIVLTGTLSAGASNGTSGQLLSSTGTGVQWVAAPVGYSAPTIGSTSIASGATVPSLAGLTNITAATHATLDGNGYEVNLHLMSIMGAI